MIKKAVSGVYCDVCKAQYGQYRDKATNELKWHKNAIRQAYVTLISETHTGKEPIIRSYCYSCVQENSKWSDGTVWTLAEQVQYAKDNRHQLKLGF